VGPVGVTVGVGVIVGVCVMVAVAVGVGVIVGVGVGPVGVSVGVSVIVGVSVGVAVGPPGVGDGVAGPAKLTITKNAAPLGPPPVFASEKSNSFTPAWKRAGSSVLNVALPYSVIR
jgi:hypothetical protein